VQRATGRSAPLPEKLAILGRRTEPVALIDPRLEALESAVASCF